MDATVVPLAALRRLSLLEQQRRTILGGFDVPGADTFEDDLSLIDRLQLAEDQLANEKAPGF